MRALIIVCVLLFVSTLRANVNTFGETRLQDEVRVTALISAGYARYFIHLYDLSRLKRVIICETLFDDIESAGLSAWETLGKAGVTYERGFKTYKIDDTNVFLSCASVGD